MFFFIYSRFFLIFNLIAIFDPTAKRNSIINFLPLSIQNSSIIFPLNDYSKDDIEEISLKMFEDKHSNEIKLFLRDLNLITSYIEKNQSREIFTLNDIRKFEKFLKESNNSFDYKVLAKIILINRFSSKEEIEKDT